MLNRIFSLLISCLFTTVLIGQTEADPTLRQDFEKYFKTVTDLDVEKTLDYIYPKLFDQVPRDQMAKALQMAYDNPEMSIAMDNSEIGKIDPVFSHEGINYTQVRYNFSMHLTFKMSDEDVASMSEVMLESFKGEYGTENVSWNEKEKTVSINLKNAMLAIKDPAFGDGWKFLEKKESLFPMLKEILPEKVFDHLTKD